MLKLYSEMNNMTNTVHITVKQNTRRETHHCNIKRLEMLMNGRENDNMNSQAAHLPRKAP